MKISIDGNIGGGKTTILTKLCEEFRIPVFLEPIQEWQEWLTLFYENPERWGMSFNLNVLLSFSKWKDNNFMSLYERSPLTNRYVFSELQKEEGNISDLELELFDKIYDKIAWIPDIIIYIRTSPEICMTRMKKRGRLCEEKVSYDYLKSLHDKYEELFTKETNKYKVYILDGNKTADEVYQDVKNLIKQLLNT